MQTQTYNRIEVSGGSSLFLEWPSGKSLRIDAEGRWANYQTGMTLYRRTLDARVVKQIGKSYILVSDEDAREISNSIRDQIEYVLNELRGGFLEIEYPGQEITNMDLEYRLSSALEWIYKPNYLENARFEEAYPEEIMILPPDRYRDLVIQPALGCPYAQCNFCAFYKDHTFRVLKEDELDTHIEAVKKLFGRTLQYRNGIFLGSASALSLSQRRVIQILKKVDGLLPKNRRGVAAFLDPDHAPDRDYNDYQELAKLGLSQATIGLETGQPELRKQLGKRSNLEKAINAIQFLKQAKIQVVLTILVGAGGRTFTDTHRTATTHFIENAGLNKKDIVYLSPLENSLIPVEMNQEVNRFRKALRQITPARISPYNMERFYYFA